MMQVSKSLITTLQILIAGGRVAASKLREDFARELMSEGFITVHSHGSRRTFSAINTKALKDYLTSRCESLRLLESNNFNSWDKEILSRSELATDTGNSKLVKVRSCPGFPINSFEPIKCLLCGSEFVVCPPNGSFMFVDNWQSFIIPKDVVVVGIENMENFRMIREQRAMFESQIGMHSFIFVSRYPQSTDLRKWLQRIPNRYVHFGDFDLAGINIFITEFQKYLGERSSFFIPSDIEERLAKGSNERYDAQYSRFNQLHTDEPYLQRLIDLINKYHRGYDQEGLISLSTKI